jgi:dienelactone hydrolase
VRARAARLVRRGVGRLAALVVFASGCGDPHEVELTPGPPRLFGYVYRPDGPGPFPAIVYNHGSEAEPDRPPAVASFFTSHGYVLLAPHRRGHGRSGGRHERAVVGAAPRAEQQRVFVDELVAQVDDVLAGVAWLKRQAYVDPARIAVAGCSLGSVEALLVAERPTEVRAAVSISGGISGWTGNGLLRARMLEAVSHATIPVLVVQAENDYSTPAPILGEAMERAGKPHRIKVYPPFGVSREEGHGHFCARGSVLWGDEVLGFLRENLR